MKAIEKNYYPQTKPNKKSNSLTDTISYWLMNVMFRATPGMNVLVGSMVRVSNR